MPKKISARSSTSVNSRKITSRLRSNRVTKRPNRLGVRRSSINGDAFFECLNSSQTKETETVPFESSTDTPTFDSIPSGNLIDSPQENLMEKSADRNTNDSVNLCTPITSTPPLLRPNERTFGMTEHDRDSSQGLVLLQLKEILVRLGELEKHTAQIDTRIIGITNELKSARQLAKPVTKINAIDKQDLLTFGLPVHSQLSLDKLEKQLTEHAFSSSLVSTRKSLIVSN